MNGAPSKGPIEPSAKEPTRGRVGASTGEAGTAAGVLTVTANPAVDKTYFVERFEKGAMTRVGLVRDMPGGKGINVSRVMHTLGYPVLATGFLGGKNGEWIESRLIEGGLSCDFVQGLGETRTTLAIVEEKSGQVTELLEAGPAVDSAKANELLAKVESLAKNKRFVTLSGSLPKGLPTDYYAQLVERVQRQGALACIDTSGEALRLAMAAKPYLVKVNHVEFAELIGKSAERPIQVNQESVRESGETPAGESDDVKWMRQLEKFRENTCEVLIVTRGVEGSYACDESGVWHVSTPKVNTVNAVGSGDAFLAGLVGGFLDGPSLPQALSQASAAGASNAAKQGAGLVDVKEVLELRQQVHVRRLSQD